MLLASSLSAQLQDNFTDGDFTNNPTWSGDDTKFSVDAGLLRLTAPSVTSTAYLSTGSSFINNTSWEFYFRYDESPSSSNFVRVYLTSTQANLSGSLNGYFVMIGGTTKEVSLYRQTGTTRTEIIDGLDRNGAAKPGGGNYPNDFGLLTKVKVKVIRDAAGNWTLLTDTSPTGPTGTYSFEGTKQDLTHITTSFFGPYIAYTSTRSTLYWFDDFLVEAVPIPDTSPPQLKSVDVVTNTSIKLFFDESLDPNTAETVVNFLINNQMPESAVLQPGDTTVLLTISSPLVNGLPYALRVTNVADLIGNAIDIITYEGLYFEPAPVSYKDIIISEFMADPSPPNALPEAEFIELFNRSANPINLQNWTLSDGNTTATLPNYILLPRNYLVISTTTGASSFTNALGVASFPSLNNAGDNIVLKDNQSILVDSIQYTMAWYNSQEKQDGGWSLEIVDPENLCEEGGNWTASEASAGGTPGTVNSVNANNPDVQAPSIESGHIKDARIIVVRFNEKLDGNNLISGAVEPSVGIRSITYSSDLRHLTITTNNDLLPSITYTLTLDNVYDCSGNALVDNQVHLILPEAAAVGDILLNEILFNPKPGGVDFIEVYNTSAKYISLKNWALTNLDGETTSNPKPITSELVISPKSFLVFTPDPDVLKAHYPRAVDAACVLATLPSMNDDEGSLALMDSLGLVFDALIYADDWHSPFLKDAEGVSLERVSLQAATNRADNWQSASQQENFATPGYKNSASVDGTVPRQGEVVIEPEVFSPQQPPTSFTTINYKFKQSGQVVNAQILDHQGRLIKTLANNEVLGTEGFFRWDGDRDDGGQARAGYYIAWLEVFDPQGNVQTIRKRVVVSGR